MLISEFTDPINETIRRVKGGYRLVSKSGRNLGTYPNRAGAERREQQVRYFKHVNEDTGSFSKGDPVIVVGGSRFVGAAGEIDEITPNNVRVNLYNYGLQNFAPTDIGRQQAGSTSHEKERSRT